MPPRKNLKSRRAARPRPARQSPAHDTGACPRCGSREFWALGTGRRRCARCRYDWRPGRWPLRLTEDQWRDVLRWIVRGLPSAAIAEETGVQRKRVLRALLVVRQALAAQQPRGGRGAMKGRAAPVIGLQIARSHDEVWAGLVPEPDADRFRRAVAGSRGARRADAIEGGRYAAVVYRGRFHRLTGPAGAAPRFGPLEAFFAFLRRELRGRGGIRRNRLGLYLAEYSWRFNRRRVPAADRLEELAGLVHGWHERDLRARAARARA